VGSPIRQICIIAGLLCLHCGSDPVNSQLGSQGAYASAHRIPNSIVAQPRTLKFMMWPVANRKLSQGYKAESGRQRAHDGIDISAPKGTHIYAPADGTVIYAGQKFHGYGKMIMIEHTPTITTLYGHCQKLLVREGEPVRRGTLIALVGRTGHATGTHLHFEVRVKREPVDPLIYLE
jgi:murein DD-endopeptidase MepM/ murein hydrolase activator NlpD